jgi:hypothetical protein
MTLRVQHKRSAVRGKVPLASDLEYGEIAVNYEATEPALYVKDSANAVRKIGTPINATTTAYGVVQLADAAAVTAGTAGRVVDAAQLKAGTFWTRSGTTLGAATAGDLLAPASLPSATTAALGAVQLATSAEAVAGTDTAKAVTPKALHDGYQVKPKVDVVTASKAVAAGTYVVVTTGGLTLTLPATPAPGDHLTVVVAGTFADTKLAHNGHNIMGLAEDLTLDKPHAAMDLTYVDATNGWRLS